MVVESAASTLIRWIPLLPLGGAGILTLMLISLRRSPDRKWIAALSLFPSVVSFCSAGIAFSELMQAVAIQRSQIDSLGSFMGLGVAREAFTVDFAFRFDTLSGTMALIVTGTAVLVQIYSIAYTGIDRGRSQSYQRFCAVSNLLVGALLVMVLANNLVIILAGWMGVGLSISLLIGFRFDDRFDSMAAIRSIVLSTVCDAFLIFGFVGLFWLLVEGGTGTTDLARIELGLRGSDGWTSWKILGFEFRPLTPIAFCLAIAAFGRSAQLPFHFALSGVARAPVPGAVLSILGASGGVYLLCRMSFVFAASPGVSALLAWAGGATAVLAALAAVAQRDVVRILVSFSAGQLGIAFVAVGCGAFATAIFQLSTFNFVQALLLLVIGCVVQLLRGQQDIRRMEGLRTRLPWLHATAMVGVLSPGLWLAREQSLTAVIEAKEIPAPEWLYALCLLAVMFCTWALFRLVARMFWGGFRTPMNVGEEISDPSALVLMPLYALSFAAVLGVVFNPAQIWGDLLPGGVEGSESLALFLSSSLGRAPETTLLAELRWQRVGGAALASIIGFAIAYYLYVRFPRQRRRLSRRLAPIQNLMGGRRVGSLLDRAVAAPLVLLSRTGLERGVEQGLVDGVFVKGFANAVRSLATYGLKTLQPGLLQVYLLVMLAGLLALLSVI